MLKLADQGEAEWIVRPADSAKVIALSPDDVYPDVFATTRMIALMEIAASRVLRVILKPGEMSVGVEVRVRHTAPTPIGAKVRGVATYLGPEGKLFKFHVQAFDEAGLIGDGEHTRAIIETSRLISGASRRKPS